MLNLLDQLAADLAGVDLSAIQERKSADEQSRTQIIEAIARADDEIQQRTDRIRTLDAGPDAEMAAEALLAGKPTGNDLVERDTLISERAALIAGRTKLHQRLDSLPSGRSAYRESVDNLTGPMADPLSEALLTDVKAKCSAIATAYADAKAIAVATGSSVASRLAILLESLLNEAANCTFVDRADIDVSDDVAEALKCGDAAMALAYRSTIEAVNFPRQEANLRFVATADAA